MHFSSKSVRRLSAVVLSLCVAFVIMIVVQPYLSVAALSVSKPLCGTWQAIQGPQMEADEMKGLRSVLALSNDNVWAVGGAKTKFLGPYAWGNSQPLIRHWNGSKWSSVALAQIEDNKDYTLTSVGADSEDNIWAVGYSDTKQRESKTFVAHWDGSSWQAISSPSPGRSYNVLRKVFVVSQNEAFAVGSYKDNNIEHVLVLHWDGHKWGLFKGPDLNGVSAALVSVVAISLTNVWAVGYYKDKEQPQHPLIVHWDGKSWSTLFVKGSGEYMSLNSIAAVSPSNIWAVGGAEEGRELIMHWDGRSWSVDTNADYFGPLSDVVVNSKDDVWAVGPSAGVSVPIVRRWDGHTWLNIPAPQVRASQNFRAITLDPSGGVWAVGYTFDNEDGPYYALAAHFTKAVCTSSS